MRKVKWTVVGIAVIVAIAAVIFLLNRPSTSSTIKMGYLPIASDADFFVALDQGFFAGQGIQVEPTKFETSNQALEALVAGRIDATAPVALEAALALEVNTPGQFQIIEMTAATEKTSVHRIMVKPDSPIKSLANLKGKRVGTFPGSQMVVFLKLILSRYFDADKEVEIIQLKAPLQPQALETGQIDAVFCLEPTCTLLESSGIGRAISVNPLYEFIQKPFPTAVGVVSSRLAKERPDVVRKIAAALQSAHEFMTAKPEEASKSIPKYAPIEADLAPRIAVYDYWDMANINKDSVQSLANLYADKGIITKRVNTASLYANVTK